MTAPQDHIPALKPKRRIRGEHVAALWTVDAIWIALEVLLPPHRTEAILWRAAIALGLTAAASSLLVVWCLIRALIEPVTDERTAFRIGYRAGYADAADGREPCKVWLLPPARSEAHSTHGNRVS
jgi:hypothetical protein